MHYSFCPQCGSPLTVKHDGGRDRAACPACPFIAYGRFTVGVGGLLVHDGRVLLIQRGEDPGKGRWTLPGGYLEEDEAPDDGLVREVLEETGLRVKPTGILSVRHVPMMECQNVYIVFGLDLDGPLCDLREKGTGHEIAQARFIARDDLKALGDIGLISRWVAEVLDPHAPPLQRVPRDEEDRLRFTGAWMALFTASAKPGKTLCAHGGAKDL